MLLRAGFGHRRLQLLETGSRMLRIHFRAQCRDLMLQVMCQAPNRFDVFLGRQIFLMLTFQLRVYGGQFGARSHATGLLLLRIQNRETAEIHQSANIEHLLAHRARKWRIGGYEAQIAHGERHNGDGGRANRQLCGSGRRSITGKIPTLDQPCYGEACGIHYCQHHRGH